MQVVIEPVGARAHAFLHPYLIARLDQFEDDETIGAGSGRRMAGVASRRDASLDDKLAAIIYYAENDAWLPIELAGVG